MRCQPAYSEWTNWCVWSNDHTKTCWLSNSVWSTSVFPRSGTGSRRPKHEGPGHNQAPEYVQAEGAQVSIEYFHPFPFPLCLWLVAETHFKPLIFSPPLSPYRSSVFPDVILFGCCYDKLWILGWRREVGGEIVIVSQLEVLFLTTSASVSAMWNLKLNVR